MQITLPSDMEAAVRTRVDSGAFASPEDVVRAALVALKQQEEFGDFAPGELDELLAEGEASIDKEGTLDGDDAFEARRARRAGRAGGQ